MDVNHPFDRRDFLKGTVAASLSASAFSTLAFLGTSENASGAPISDALDVASSPYGVCAHIARAEEFDLAPDNLILMKEAGIRWVRADFSWNGVEYEEGKWNFDHLDTILEKTEEVGLQVLPILDYDVPWASPAFEHLDKWLLYVKKIVERYKDRIQYWEVWNEEDLEGFWHAKPNAKDYAKMLAATYRLIKEIDPNLIVVYGGLSGVPLEYFKTSLEDAPNSFDVINIHPYRGGITTRERIDKFQADLKSFNAALRERGLPERPIWITEMGWATPPVFGDVNRRVVCAAIQRLYPDKQPKVAFFWDERYEPSGSRPRDDFYKYLPEEYDDRRDLVTFLDADELKEVSNDDVDLIVMPPSETFPSDCFDALVAFVKEGGALVLNGGVPLYYESSIDPETGLYRQERSNPNFNDQMAALRISWFAWWTREGVPESLPATVAHESAAFKPRRGKNALEGFYSGHEATRFFDDKALKEGDKLIPLIEGRNESFNAATACIYDFDSDYKGAVVVNAVMDHDGTNTNVATPATQAIFLPQAYLLAFAAGIERFFWYEFHAPQGDMKDPEHHFGIVGKTLEPKPGYYAYKVLTTARPAGSKHASQVLVEDDVTLSWTRSDGKKGWAIWSSRTAKEKTVAIKGKVDEAFDYLGNAVAKPSDGEKITIAPGVLYLIGPDEVVLKD